jgi:disulfide bond formation protein DsbB
MRPERIAIVVGLIALSLIAGALGFQYLDNLPPCEICHWQRWPLIAAAILGIGGGALASRANGNSALGVALVLSTILLVAISGAIGVYHAGIEWHFWPGPTACTGRVIFTGTLDLNHPAPRCDAPAWRLFGLSLAGYNAIACLGTSFAAIGALLRNAR